MLSLTQIESDLTQSLKARDSLTANVLRALKTRIQNEKIAKQKDLTDVEISALVRNELKRRKEAAGVYEQGGRSELAEKEILEAQVLQKYLPPEMSESQITSEVEKLLSENSFTIKDLGQAMGKLKAAMPDADGALVAKILKEKLK